MYNEQRVMKNKMSRKTGAKEYNFKKQSAGRVIKKTKYEEPAYNHKRVKSPQLENEGEDVFDEQE
jgi:hypothetical protein